MDDAGAAPFVFRSGGMRIHVVRFSNQIDREKFFPSGDESPAYSECNLCTPKGIIAFTIDSVNEIVRAPISSD